MKTFAIILSLVMGSLLWGPSSWAQESDWATRTLTLEEARALLQEASSLRVIDKQIESTQALEDQAYNIFYPNVTLAGVYTLNDEELTFGMGNMYAPLLPYLQAVYDTSPGLQAMFDANPEMDARNMAQAEMEDSVIQQRHDFKGVLTVTQVLFNYRAFPLLDMAAASISVAENGREQVLEQLDKSLLQLYFNAVTMKRLISVSERNVELAEISRDTAIAARDAEVGLQFEVNRAEVSLSSARRDLENARLAYQLLIEALATLLETEPDFDVSQPPERAAPSGLERMTDEAIESSAVVSSHSLNKTLELAKIDEVDSRFWPTVYAQAQALMQQESAFGGDNFKWMITVTASWTLYDGGMRSLERTQYELASQQHEIQDTIAIDQLKGEVRQAYLGIASEERKVESAQAEVDLARENLDLTNAARELDSATYVDVEVAQRQLYLAEIALTTAAMQTQARIYELERLRGAW